MLCSPNVAFCGYSIPHPAEALVNIRVQTTGVFLTLLRTRLLILLQIHSFQYCYCSATGQITATEALQSACQNLKEVCQHVKDTFQTANQEFDGSQDMQT